MPCGTWTEKDVPDDKVGGVIAGFNLDSPKSVTKTKQPDGKWTVVATFAPCPDGSGSDQP